MICSVSNFC